MCGFIRSLNLYLSNLSGRKRRNIRATVCQPGAEGESHPSHDADGLGGQEARVAHFVVHNAVENLLLIITGERRLKESDTRYSSLLYSMKHVKYKPWDDN